MFKSWYIVIITRRSGGTVHEGEGATSQLDLPFLTPLSVADCGRLQLGVPQWATCDRLLQVRLLLTRFDSPLGDYWP